MATEANGTSPHAQRRFDGQWAVVEKSFDQVQLQIRHYDDILFKIKAGAITVWVAVIGWAFAAKLPSIMALGFVVIIGFWMLEAIFKGSQLRALAASDQLHQWINDTAGLDRQFASLQLADHIIYPIAPSRSELERVVLLFRGMISSQVATVYLFLGFVNYLLWMTMN